MFSDEAGCFTFARGPNISRYFIIGTVTTSDLKAAEALRELRRELIWSDGYDLGEFFHATSDKQNVRDRVFAEIVKHDFRIQATICEKSKAQPQVKKSRSRFYQYPWFYHMKHGITPRLTRGDELHVTAASIGSKKEKDTFCGAVEDAVGQMVKKGAWRVDFRPSQADEYLQVADYATWAIQRKWEKGDTRSYDQIKDRITYEYNLWERGTTHYY
ncbi:hypothetical protein CDV50_10380 [Haematobacter massiliensis]|uniref:DUF3800 domain-containing protein n=1 Tax=Haematobacter massiliensis TaxID=195105 RepID=UPI000B4A3279|nr:DUF3800 domain-containing protein [Haematobacter massiliensis]OWJ71402.1 hypothetical protein CDV50_10380 [Haematobacter massiliensis]